MMEPQKMTLKDYLTLSQKKKIEPSFFHTLPYLEFAGAEAWECSHWTWVECQGWIMFTPILNIKFDDDPFYFPKGDIWCLDLKEDLSVWSNWQPQFLDFEYIFDPAAFNDMSGGKWNTFRKNSRKWPRKHPKLLYTDELIDWGPLTVLMGEWLEGRSDKAEDVELMTKYALSSRSDVGKKFMYKGTEEGWELVGVNVWDRSWKYINYNLCVTKAGERFLDEFMRLSFYKDTWLQMSGRLVCDGGSLGREGLERFKDKMNPHFKRRRYSLIKGNKS